MQKPRVLSHGALGTYNHVWRVVGVWPYSFGGQEDSIEQASSTLSEHNPPGYVIWKAVAAMGKTWILKSLRLLLKSCQHSSMNELLIVFDSFM